MIELIDKLECFFGEIKRSHSGSQECTLGSDKGERRSIFPRSCPCKMNDLEFVLAFFEIKVVFRFSWVK